MNENQNNGPDLGGNPNPNSNPNPQQDYSNQQQFNQQTPPPFNQTINVQVPSPGYVPKSKIAAGLLGIFLGSFGVHNFYLGYTGKAVAQLLITVLTCGIGAAVTSIWGLIEGILILTGSIAVDANGVPLQQ